MSLVCSLRRKHLLAKISTGFFPRAKELHAALPSIQSLASCCPSEPLPPTPSTHNIHALASDPLSSPPSSRLQPPSKNSFISLHFTVIDPILRQNSPTLANTNAASFGLHFSSSIIPSPSLSLHSSSSSVNSGISSPSLLYSSGASTPALSGCHSVAHPLTLHRPIHVSAAASALASTQGIAEREPDYQRLRQEQTVPEGGRGSGLGTGSEDEMSEEKVVRSESASKSSEDAGAAVENDGTYAAELEVQGSRKREEEEEEEEQRKAEEEQNRNENRNTKQEDVIAVKAFYVARSLDLKSIIESPFRTKRSALYTARNNVILTFSNGPLGLEKTRHQHIKSKEEEEEEEGEDEQPQNNRPLGERYMVAYQYGAVILFNFSKDDQEEALELIASHATHPFKATFKDDYGVIRRPSLKAWSEGGYDHVVVKTLDTNNIRVISSVLAQSVALDYYSMKVDDMVTTFRELNQGMEQAGTFTMTRSKLFQLVAAANTTLADVILRISLVERSDTAWRYAQYSKIWEYMRDDFELDKRFESLDFKLNIIQTCCLVLALRQDAPSLSQRLHHAARSRADARVTQASSQAATMSGRVVSSFSSKATATAGRRQPKGGGTTAAAAAEAEGAGAGQDEQDGARGGCTAGSGGEAHDKDDAVKQAQRRLEEERLRKEHDKRSRAYARYQGQNRQQQRHHFFWDGQSFGHGWDADREQEERRRQHMPRGLPGDVTSLWHAEHWNALGLDMLQARSISAADIKAAFRAKALEHHPDRNPTEPEVAAVQFRRVLRAYEVLSRYFPRRTFLSTTKH